MAIPLGSLTANGVLIGEGTGAIVATAVGTSGQVLTSNGAGSDPTFQAAPLSPAYSRATTATTQSIPNNTFTALIFDVNNFDVGGIHSTTVNNTRFTIPTGQGGKYLIGAFADIPSGATVAQFLIRPFVNGTTLIDGAAMQIYSPGNSGGIMLGFTTLATFNAGDYVEFQVFQGTGGSQSTNVAAAPNYYNPSGWVIRVA